jgi:inner membrane protein
MMNPFRWYGVAETPAAFAMMNVDTLMPEIDPEGRMQFRYKPEETPITLAAKKSYLGRVYLDWAKYPVTEAEPVNEGSTVYIVRFRDLRYAYPGSAARATLGAMVLLDRDLRVVDERFGLRPSSASSRR